MITEQLKFDLWMALNASQHADWFTAHLFRLFMKADGNNRRKLSRVFPNEYDTFVSWHDSPNEREWYGTDIINKGEKAREEARK